MTADPKHNPRTNPAVLIEVTRGPIVESWHHGVLAVCDAEDNLIAWAGDPGVVTYYRSSSKPIQATLLVERGGADHFGLTDEEVAITCGSHGGTDDQIRVVMGILEKIGLGTDALACGAHIPYDKIAARNLEERGEAPTVLHNNCSGKHAGMLALAKFEGWPIGGYEMASHPVQKAVLGVIAEFAGVQPDQVAVGVDGCGVCTFGVTVQQMATSFARLAQPDFWPEPRRSAVARITRSMIAHPVMVSGENEFDTDAMIAAGGSLICKAGAEGVACAAQLANGGERALGLALKLLDGDRTSRARDPSVTEGLRQAGMLSEDALNKLERYWLEEVRNRPGDVVGVLRPAFTLSTR
ncbi:MAG TPA: asparaginase [Chloroflexia bacterium]|nr:asparaginase [Chloroflexia bacterium]